MSNTQWSNLSKSQQAREDFYDSGAPVDPVALHQQHDGTHYNRALHTTLMPTSHMSVGYHMGKIMTAVPLPYLAWVDAQRWSKSWHQWQPVADYLKRYPVSSLLLRELPSPLITLSPAGRLSCQPGHEDKLQTFAKGALNISQICYRPPHHFRPPHYELSPVQAALARRHGAHPITNTDVLAFLKAWETHLQQCTRHCYPSQEEAEAEANYANPRRKAKGQLPLYPVFCEPCDFWHVSTKLPEPKA